MTAVEDSRLQVILATGEVIRPPVYCVRPTGCFCCGLMALLPAHIMPWHKLCIWPKPEQELCELPDPSSPLANLPECKTCERARPEGPNKF